MLSANASAEGWDFAAEMLEYYLKSSGMAKTFDASNTANYQTTYESMKTNVHRLFSHDGGGKYDNIGDFLTKNNLKNNQKAYYTDHYENVVKNIVVEDSRGGGIPEFDTEAAYALGDFTLVSTAHFNIERKGKRFYISGDVEHQGKDVYDWNGNGFAVNILGVTIYDNMLAELKGAGAKTYRTESTKWKTKIKDGSYIFKNKDGTWNYSKVVFEYEEQKEGN